MDFLTLIQVLDSTVRMATPLLLACLAGLFSERAGIFDIGLEGKMLMAAFSLPPSPPSPGMSGLAYWPGSAHPCCSLACTVWRRSPSVAIS